MKSISRFLGWALDRIVAYFQENSESIAWKCLIVVILYLLIKTGFDCSHHYTPTI